MNDLKHTCSNCKYWSPLATTNYAKGTCLNRCGKVKLQRDNIKHCKETNIITDFDFGCVCFQEHSHE